MEEKERKPYFNRLLGLGIVVVLVFVVLVVNLWRLQIAQGAYYADKAQGNARKLVKISPTRGDVIDRNGKLLVTSIPEFVLNIDTLDLQQSNSTKQEVVHSLAKYVEPYWPNPNQSVELIAEDILASIQQANVQNYQQERYRPVMVLTGVPQELQAAIAEHQEELPGVRVEATPVRYYPEKALAGQLLGYVREISAKEIDYFNQNTLAQEVGFEYAQGDLVGKDGVERAYDFWLRGVEGEQQVEVDSSARPLDKKTLKDAEAGKTVQLTIDADLQKAVEESLDGVLADIRKENPAAHAGAAVVIEVNTGKILAMASRPAMDPNELTGNISQAISDKYFTNKEMPQASLNRAVSGVYPPGSTFKMVTAMAALKLNLTTPYEQIDDRMSSLGSLYYQQQGVPEWGGGQYFGIVDLYQALAKSSNIYFQAIGRRVFEADPEMIRQVANEFGLGVLSGIDLPNEAKGVAPSAQWKKDYYGPIYEKRRDEKLAEIESAYAEKLAGAADVKEKEKLQKDKETAINQVQTEYRQNVSEKVDWKPYDSHYNSIGQGDNSYSPLQLANYVATIVNGGKHYQPYVVDRILDPLSGEVVYENQPKVLNSASVSPEKLDHVKQGMRAVVSWNGSDFRAGTAYWTFNDLPDFTGGAKTGTAQIGNANTALGKVYNGMFVAFAPYEQPQIAFGGVVECGESGSGSAGYVAKAAFMKYFGWNSSY